MSDLTELPNDTDELLAVQRAAAGRYETAQSQMRKDHAALTHMSAGAELDRLLSSGGHLPEDWRNARR